MQEKLKQQTANVTKQKNKKNNNFISGIDKLTSKKEKDINKQKQLKLQNQEEKSTKETSEEIKSRKEHRMKVIVGLGNPTDQYKGTRHNVGYMAIDRIAEANRININQHKFKAMVGSGIIGGSKVLLVKPLTYMNLSGESIRPIMDFYKLDLSDILVIYDDISLEPGVLRLRTKGSAGGHNGMKSIIKHLGGDTFPRIRVGIGGEKHPGQDLADYVLGHFKDDEKELLSDALDKAEKAAELFAQDEAKATAILNIDREGKKPRKDIAKWSDVLDYVSYMYDETFVPNYELNGNATPSLAVKVIEEYLKVVNLDDDKDAWFGRMKDICPLVGCTPNVKEYKAEPEKFEGHVGDVSTIIRVALTGRTNTPDLFAITALLGEDTVKARLNSALKYYKEEM